jgi:hypothetical protein
MWLVVVKNYLADATGLTGSLHEKQVHFSVQGRANEFGALFDGLWTEGKENLVIEISNEYPQVPCLSVHFDPNSSTYLTTPKIIRHPHLCHGPHCGMNRILPVSGNGHTRTMALIL